MRLADRILDTRPLRSTGSFRYLFAGSAAASFGHQAATVAILLQVWQLTGNPAWVGAVGLANAVPMIAGGLVGGHLADAHDRKRLLLWTAVAGMLASALLAGQARAGLDSLAVVLGLVAAQAAASALGAPARRALIPRLLPEAQVSAGIALTHVSFQAAMLLGPTVGGLVAAGWGVAACYLLNTVATAVTLACAVRLPATPPAGGATGGSKLRVLLGGWHMVTRRPVLGGAFLTDLAATLLAMPIALFPMVNEERFGGDPRTLGLFLSAIAVGGVTAGLTSGFVTRHRRPGRVMLAAAALWGLALAGFGLAGPLWLALACLAVAGAADTVSVISRGTIVQLATPDAYRGRVGGLDHVVGAAAPDLGNLRAGLVAGLTSSTVALVAGGLTCVLAVAAVAVGVPAVRRFTWAADAAPGRSDEVGGDSDGGRRVREAQPSGASAD